MSQQFANECEASCVYNKQTSVFCGDKNSHFLHSHISGVILTPAGFIYGTKHRRCFFLPQVEILLKCLHIASSYTWAIPSGWYLDSNQTKETISKCGSSQICPRLIKVLLCTLWISWPLPLYTTQGSFHWDFFKGVFPHLHDARLRTTCKMMFFKNYYLLFENVLTVKWGCKVWMLLFCKLLGYPSYLKKTKTAQLNRKAVWRNVNRKRGIDTLEHDASNNTRVKIIGWCSAADAFFGNTTAAGRAHQPFDAKHDLHCSATSPPSIQAASALNQVNLAMHTCIHSNSKMGYVGVQLEDLENAIKSPSLTRLFFRYWRQKL